MSARLEDFARLVRPILVAVALVMAVSAANPLRAAVGASVAGTVFNDLNGNGVFEGPAGPPLDSPGEPGLSGVTVGLDTNLDGTADVTTTTDVNGNYSFTGLAAGTVRVRQVVPAGSVQTTANPADIVLSGSTSVTGVDFGDFSTITISGKAFDDLNVNGALNPGEPGRGGVTIQLDLGADGSVDATQLTDVNGNYSFPTLGPGIYRIREVVPVGTAQTTSNPADITASSGSDVSGINFGSVTLTPTTTTISTSGSPSTQGDSVTFTATVTSGAGTPTGSVTFFDGSTPLGTVPLDGSGHASLTTSGLAVGSHSITAAYGGSATTFASSTSQALVQQVLVAPGVPTLDPRALVLLAMALAGIAAIRLAW